MANISIYEDIAVSELSGKVVMPALYQAGLGMIPGNTYKLTFSSDITNGILTAYQGDQLIYSSAIVFVGFANILYDIIHITERITMDRRSRIIPDDSITISENITIDTPLPINLFDSITVSESFTH